MNIYKNLIDQSDACCLRAAEHTVKAARAGAKLYEPSEQANWDVNRAIEITHMETAIRLMRYANKAMASAAGMIAGGEA